MAGLNVDRDEVQRIAETSTKTSLLAMQEELTHMETGQLDRGSLELLDNLKHLVAGLLPIFSLRGSVTRESFAELRGLADRIAGSLEDLNVTEQNRYLLVRSATYLTGLENRYRAKSEKYANREPSKWSETKDYAGYKGLQRFDSDFAAIADLMFGMSMALNNALSAPPPQSAAEDVVSAATVVEGGTGETGDERRVDVDDEDVQEDTGRMVAAFGGGEEVDGGEEEEIEGEEDYVDVASEYSDATEENIGCKMQELRGILLGIQHRAEAVRLEYAQHDDVVSSALAAQALHLQFAVADFLHEQPVTATAVNLNGNINAAEIMIIEKKRSYAELQDEHLWGLGWRSFADSVSFNDNVGKIISDAETNLEIFKKNTEYLTAGVLDDAEQMAHRVAISGRG